MQPLSIVIAFGFLGMLVIIGSQLMVWSSRRLLGLHSPILSFHAGAGAPRTYLRVPLYGVLLALGLFLLTQGTLGVYRLIWVG